jgi:putative transposase
MTEQEKELKNKEIMDFRYTIIAELLNPYLDRKERRKLIREKANREYQIPYSSKSKITAACITNWYKAFKDYGKEGLKPKKRLDTGICRALSPGESTTFLQYLEENPELTAKAAYRKLKEKGIIQSELSKSALSCLVVSAGLQRNKRRMAKDERKQLKFSFNYPLECIQADMMHAFSVPDANGKLRKAILLAIIDDATRRIVYANFSFRECSLEFEYGIKNILLTHGRIGRIYCDNGAPFVSSETKRILSILGIPLIHSTVRYAQGRGKIERYFRTVRDGFIRLLDKDSIASIEELNAKFHTWLESEYHRNPHRGLGGKTPLDVWLEKAHLIIPFPPTINLDEIMRHEVSRKVYNDCTITLDGNLYEVPPHLKRKNIKILFNPFKPVRTLEIFFEGKSQGMARLVNTYANSKIRRNVNTKSFEITEKNESLIEQKERGNPTQAALSASNISLSKKEVKHD